MYSLMRYSRGSVAFLLVPKQAMALAESEFHLYFHLTNLTFLPDFKVGPQPNSKECSSPCHCPSARTFSA